MQLTICLRSDRRDGLGETAPKAKAKTYQGEELAFATPGLFFGKLSEKCLPADMPFGSVRHGNRVLSGMDRI